MRPYVDRPVTDGVAASQAAAAAADAWELPAPELLRLGMNAIFRAGNVVLRVAAPTAPASVSLELAAVVRAAGVDVLLPARSDVYESGELSVTAWPYTEPDETAVDWRSVGRQLRRVHEIDPGDLPAGLPTPSPVEFAWWDFDRLLQDVGARLDRAALDGIEAALARNAGWDSFGVQDSVVCHGDVHPGNVMQTGDGPLLIDWDLVCLAPPGWDHAPMMTWTERWGGEPGSYEALAEGYGRSMVTDPWASRFAELRLLAATLMRVRASLRDEAAWPEANRRLAYWRGEPDAPVWRAV